MRIEKMVEAMKKGKKLLAHLQEVPTPSDAPGMKTEVVIHMGRVLGRPGSICIDRITLGKEQVEYCNLTWMLVHGWLKAEPQETVIEYKLTGYEK